MAYICRGRTGSGALLLAITALACSDAPETTESIPAPRLALTDSLILDQTPEVTLGDVSHFAMSATDVWVVDGQNDRLVRYARDGTIRGTMGRKGTGPGELTLGGPLTLVGDSSVAVREAARGSIVRFRMADGAPEPELRMPEPALVMKIQAVGDAIWVGVVGLRNLTGVRRVPLDGGAVVSSVPHPAEFSTEGGVHWSLPYNVALRFGDTTLVTYAATHRTFLRRDDGGVDTLIVPNRLRRGVPVDIAERLKAGAYRDLPYGAEGAISLPLAAHRLPNGSIALVYMDAHFPDDFDVETGDGIAYRSYLTVIRPDFTAACVDAPVPTSDPSTIPALAFHGDTLSVLEQRIAGDQAVPTIVSYRVSTNGCTWQSIR